MRILINASNLKVGGGVQVADSIYRELPKYMQHTFVVVYSDALQNSAKEIGCCSNIKVVNYNMPSNLMTAITGRDVFLDRLIITEKIDSVLTIFGPSRWIPKCSHVSGFARAQLVLNDSPYWRKLSLFKKVKTYIKRVVMTDLFQKSASVFYTENSFISMKLKELFPLSKVYTVTNNYNQVFDKPELWDRSIKLPKFDGVTLLTISANYPHKNLSIIIPTIHYLKRCYPVFNFRFVLTILPQQFIPITEEESRYIVFLGSVHINQCPYLYSQCDIMFLPTLMECFSASYAEAMKMNVPIITTDLPFARSLCGNAALYYNAISSEELAKSIILLGDDQELQRELVDNGRKQLLEFDTYTQRTEKLISIVEREANS